MRNSVLHLVTNREDDFGNKIFPTRANYQPHVEGEAESTIRDLLKLRPGDGAYHLVGILAAVYAFPEVYEEFKETDRTYDLADYVKPETVVIGGHLTSAPGRVLAFNRYPIEFPVASEMSISYKDESQVRIRISENIFDADYLIRSGGKLDVTWPVETGLSGLLVPDVNPWISGSIVVISHEPTYYPYRVLAESLAKNSLVIQYLSSLGLLKNYYSAQSSIEKIAIIALAIANPSKYVI